MTLGIDRMLRVSRLLGRLISSRCLLLLLRLATLRLARRVRAIGREGVRVPKATSIATHAISSIATHSVATYAITAPHSSHTTKWSHPTRYTKSWVAIDIVENVHWIAELDSSRP